MSSPSRVLRHLAALLAASTLAGAAAAPAATQEREIFGWVEWVVVGSHGIRLKAKLDTGAETSSLDASNIRRLRRRSTGQRLVEFTLSDPETGETLTLKKPLERVVRIKQHDGSYQTRPVVTLDVCLGDYWDRVEVNLIDRSEFIYPMLLGRNALKGIALVDPEHTFTREPSCDRPQRSPSKGSD